MFTEDDYKQLIADALYQEKLIDEAVYEKCSKPHISSLPSDLRTNDSDKLNARVKELDKRIKQQNDKIKSLKEDEKKYKGKVDESADFIRKDISKIDDNLRTIFEDNFGSLGTDQPEMDNYDLYQGGSIGKREYDARNKMMGDWYKLYSDFNKFNSKLDTALTKRKSRKDIDKLIGSFNKKWISFSKKYDKYKSKYGSGYYLDTVMRGLSTYHPSDISYRELNSSFASNDDNEYMLSFAYGSYYERWNTAKSDLKKEKNILKDYKTEKTNTLNKFD